MRHRLQPAQHTVRYIRDQTTRRVLRRHTKLQYCIRLYCHGAVGMTREWLLKDNITPAETVVRMMFHAMPEAMRRVYFSDEDGTAWQKAKQGSQ